MEKDSPAVQSAELEACPICNRTFRPETLDRHYKVCEKSSQKKRRIFDSKKQRSIDTPDGPVPKSRGQKSRQAPPQAPKKPVKNTNWREKHEDLIRTIRKSRDFDKQSKDDPDETTNRIPSDYVQCPGCKRHFNQRAADRHISWCQQKQQQTPKSPIKDEAKEKLFARIKYKVPPPGKIRKALPKPKTASPPAVKPIIDPEPIEREKNTYSSPASLVDNRNKYLRYNNQYGYRKRDTRNGSGTESNSSSSPDPQSQIIKFKERFPNHINKRGVDLGESFTAEQLQELLRCSRLIDSRCPKTVPGVRLSGSKTDSWISGWNKNSFDDSALPEVSSSELPDSWVRKLGWSRDSDASASSSGSSNCSSSGSLPPMSREMDTQLLHYCHQCHHKFPLMSAKYCCECGAKRRGMVPINQAI